VDETTTIEYLLVNHIWKEPFFQTEKDCVCYWLFIGGDGSAEGDSYHVDRSTFGYPVSKEKKICKLIYKNEKFQQNHPNKF
jgi:hypothetical protein